MTATTLRLRALVLAAVLIVTGSACAGGSDASISGAPGGDQGPVEIPRPGAAAGYTPPVLPERGATMPPDTVPLEELYRQGAADVLRGLLVPANQSR